MGKLCLVGRNIFSAQKGYLIPNVCCIITAPTTIYCNQCYLHMSGGFNSSIVSHLSSHGAFTSTTLVELVFRLSLL